MCCVDRAQATAFHKRCSWFPGTSLRLCSSQSPRLALQLTVGLRQGTGAVFSLRISALGSLCWLEEGRESRGGWTLESPHLLYPDLCHSFLFHMWYFLLNLGLEKKSTTQSAWSTVGFTSRLPARPLHHFCLGLWALFSERLTGKKARGPQVARGDKLQVADVPPGPRPSLLRKPVLRETKLFFFFSQILG